MTTYRIAASAHIPAPAGTAYAIIADYQAGHPRIVPPSVFGPIEVVKGGVGAGTHIRFTVRVLGRVREGEMHVGEPDPGRVLTETDPRTGIVTSFIVEPNGTGSHVTISTELPRRGGPLGALERWAMKRFLLPVYREELMRLAAVAAE